MREAVKNWLAQSREKLAAAALSAADLDHLESLLAVSEMGAAHSDAAPAAPPRQQVLYLYAKSTNMRSPLASWALYDPTVPQEPTLPNAEPPYESVLAAVAEGWRVVQFPIAKLYAYEGQDNDYLGFEFVLERLI